ncbi:MAG: DUF983 domain-containing protein [Acetobacteraceae bacterium]|nr:DUF983 domain-containing protein [Acetobacteraceae bacterium]MSP29328.1 DUF983 domain-containing protein [Acetobacteraceae bacterium]
MVVTQRTVLLAALRCRCPRCEQGKVFLGLLTVCARCSVCDLDLSEHDAGDGPAVAVILLLGAAVVGMALGVEFRFMPPLWLHAIIWPVVTFPLAILMMRPFKAALLGQQYLHRASKMERRSGTAP